jgi:hypothetical protein
MRSTMRLFSVRASRTDLLRFIDPSVFVVSIRIVLVVSNGFSSFLLRCRRTFSV